MFIDIINIIKFNNLISMILQANLHRDQKSFLQLNLGIILSEFDKEKVRNLLKKSIERIESKDINIYLSDDPNKRMEIAKNILKLNDGEL